MFHYSMDFLFLPPIWPQQVRAMNLQHHFDSIITVSCNRAFANAKDLSNLVKGSVRPLCPNELQKYKHLKF